MLEQSFTFIINVFSFDCFNTPDQNMLNMDFCDHPLYLSISININLVNTVEQMYCSIFMKRSINIYDYDISVPYIHKLDHFVLKTRSLVLIETVCVRPCKQPVTIRSSCLTSVWTVVSTGEIFVSDCWRNCRQTGSGPHGD